MINTLYLPEIREMLALNDEAGLREFCTALHPARTAEFMEGLSAEEAFVVLQHAEPLVREELFSYFDHDKQVAIVESDDRLRVAELVADLPPDDRVDLLQDVKAHVVNELLPLLPMEERRDYLRLRAYPEDTAGAVMTTEFAKLSEALSAREALEELGKQAGQLETIYYLYIVDDTDHLRGVVSTRQLVSAMGKSTTTLGDLMEADVVTVNAVDDQEDVAKTVAHYDLLAVPVVDAERVLVGIITHDDVLDVLREEATEDAHRIAAVNPLEESYMRTPLLTLSWKRGIWLGVLFFGALLTAFALQQYENDLDEITWLVVFIPLVISSGGNTGSQSATLIITALATGDIKLGDWIRVLLRELIQGIVLGALLGLLGFLAAFLLHLAPDFQASLVIPVTLMLVVVCGTLLGSTLPLLFHRLRLDPAMMSNPFVAGIIDILGIIVFMQVARWML